MPKIKIKQQLQFNKLNAIKDLQQMREKFFLKTCSYFIVAKILFIRLKVFYKSQNQILNN
ncbi:MAG: hypothetical protein DF280_02220 ['Brassica napus' phytoplasma]|nr:MAG: hypothetical protein DF280_02220 ['Brassica napus' phytoplasma]